MSRPGVSLAIGLLVAERASSTDLASTLWNENTFPTALPSRNYSLPWPEVWELGSRVALPAGCSGDEFIKALQFVNQTFEDVELHVANGAYVGFLGAVFEPPPFNRLGHLGFVSFPGLPGSLQIAITLLSVGLLRAEDAQALAVRGGAVRLQFHGVKFEELTAPHYVARARKRLGLGPREDLSSVTQSQMEANLLWQSADELRFFQHAAPCGQLGVNIVEHRGALINALHGYATNYFHFVTEQMPALISLRAELSWMPRERIRVLHLRTSWQVELVSAAGFDESQSLHYEACSIYRADFVYTAAVPDTKAAELLLQTRNTVLHAAPLAKQSTDRRLDSCFEEKQAKPQMRIIVLERSGQAAAQRGRSLSNHVEIVQVVRTVCISAFKHCSLCEFRAEDYTVAAQARTFQAADLVVGSIGAGLTNLIFMRPGSVVVALHPAHPQTSFSVYSSRCGQSYFWHMASQLGITYRALLCREMKVFEGGRADAHGLKLLLERDVLPLALRRFQQQA